MGPDARGNYVQYLIRQVRSALSVRSHCHESECQTGKSEDGKVNGMLLKRFRFAAKIAKERIRNKPISP